MEDFEKGCKWTFTPFPKVGGTHFGPNDEATLNFGRNPYGSLIRESIQNSLDACKDDTQPVRMKFFFGRLQKNNYPNFFDLLKHIDGIPQANPGDGEDFANNLRNEFKKYEQNGYIPFLTISDYNTIGMTYKRDELKTRFYAFVHARGAGTYKQSGQGGGAFGIGKAAYFAASPIRTLLVYSKAENGEQNFQGVTKLCTHYYEGGKYNPEGYYDNNNTDPANNEIPQLFQNLRKNEHGSDISIMGLDANNQEARNEIVKAILQNYWMAVLKGKLEVTVLGNKDISNIVISSDNVERLLGKYLPDTVDNNPNKLQKSSMVNPYKPYSYFDAYHTIGENGGGEDNDTYFFFRKELPTLGECSFYLKKDSDSKGRVTFMRKPLMTVFAEHIRNYSSFYGLFLCLNDKGDYLLRKMEGSAHNSWEVENATTRYPDLLQNATNAKAEIADFIKQCLDEVFLKGKESDTTISGLNQILSPMELSSEDSKYGNKDFNNNIKSSSVGILVAKVVGVTLKPNQDKTSTGFVKSVVLGDPDDNGTPTTVRTRGDGKKGRGTGTQPGDDKDVKIKIGGTGRKASKEEPVTFHFYAQKECGTIWHHVIVNTQAAIENANLEILVGGDKSSNKLNIADIETSLTGCKVDGNKITGISIPKGSKNEIKLRFNDNMVHSLVINAYIKNEHK